MLMPGWLPPRPAWLLHFYRFFLVSFLGLLLAEETAALGFFVTSAPRGSEGSASCMVIKEESCLEESKV